MTNISRRELEMQESWIRENPLLAIQAAVKFMSEAIGKVTVRQPLPGYVFLVDQPSLSSDPLTPEEEAYEAEKKARMMTRDYTG